MSNKTMYEKEKEITDKIDVKEAIKMFQNLIFVENHKIAENHCRKLAIEALEKQIPKKPLKQECDFFDFNLVCPECKNRIVNVWNKREYKPNYCHYCGQALDWSDNNA